MSQIVHSPIENVIMAENFYPELFDVMDANQQHFSKSFVEFANGQSLSIQCSGHHYCSPRKYLQSSRLYDSFEVGYPSGGLIGKELVNFESSGIAGYIPKTVVIQIARLNGGVAKPIIQGEVVADDTKISCSKGKSSKWEPLPVSVYG